MICVMREDALLPPVTIVIEWENAIDVEDVWTARALSALERELRSVSEGIAVKPRVMFLYDEGRVRADFIRKMLAEAAPAIDSLADVEFVPTPGLTYYKLKNFGISRSKTDITVMLDSDAAPQPGWLRGLLRPFDDPEVVVVGGFTVLGHEDLLSRTFALAWIFDLPEERSKTEKRIKANANNCAVRTAFFNAYPYPDLPAFKKQCGFWLKAVVGSGYKFVRTTEALTIHAPHPGYRFLVWRAWTSGTDGDFVGHTESPSRAGRLRYAGREYAKSVKRSWKRILKKGHLVGMKPVEKPAALVIATSFYTIKFAGNVTSALTRSFRPLDAYMTRPSPGLVSATRSQQLQGGSDTERPAELQQVARSH